MQRIAIRKNSKSVLVGILIPIGSRYESPEIKGISHFVEHMLFKGTKSRSKDDIAREIEQYGAVFNAWTGEEQTFYYIKIDSKYRQVAVDVLTDMVKNANFPKKEIENEKNVIFQELQMYEDNPQAFLFDVVQREMFDKSSGLHIPIIGTKESLANIGRKELQKYYKMTYSNPILIEVGDTEAEKNVLKLSKRFDIETKTYKNNNLFVSKAGVNQANMTLASLSDYPDKILTHFYLELLGGVMNGFTGRLFKTIRDRHGLVYHVSLNARTFSCGTIFTNAYAACSPDKVILAKDLIIKELTRKISKEEIEFAKRKVIGEYKLSIDSSSAISSTIINMTLAGIDYNEYLKNFEKNIEVASRNLNDFVSHLKLEDSKLIALVPEKDQNGKKNSI
jgi:predicted Zn-dependent peptidase